MNTLLEWRRLLCTFALSIFCAVASANASCQQGEADDDDELSTVLISSTRIPRLIGDEPLKVEAVPAEEIAENSTVVVVRSRRVRRNLPRNERRRALREAK